MAPPVMVMVPSVTVPAVMVPVAVKPDTSVISPAEKTTSSIVTVPGSVTPKVCAPLIPPESMLINAAPK